MSLKLHLLLFVIVIPVGAFAVASAQRMAMADARTPGRPHLASASLHKLSDRTCRRFAVALPVLQIGQPGLFSQDNGLTLT